LDPVGDESDKLAGKLASSSESGERKHYVAELVAHRLDEVDLEIGARLRRGERDPRLVWTADFSTTYPLDGHSYGFEQKFSIGMIKDLMRGHPLNARADVEWLDIEHHKAGVLGPLDKATTGGGAARSFYLLHTTLLWTTRLRHHQRSRQLAGASTFGDFER